MIHRRVLDEAETELRLRKYQLFSSSTVVRAEIDLEHILSELGPKQARIIASLGHHPAMDRAPDGLDGPLGDWEPP